MSIYSVKINLYQCIALLFLSLFSPVMAALYYVDLNHPNASDTNPGNDPGAPWETIQKAGNTAMAEDTVYIRSGTYNERIIPQYSGLPDQFITFMAYPGDLPVLDGTGLGGWWGIFSIYGKDWIRLEDLEIRSNDTGWGILIEHDGSEDASHIQLQNLTVHYTAGECIQIRGNAHDITITDCTVHDGLGPYSGIDIYRWNSGRPHHVTVTGCTAYLFDNGYPGAGIGSEMADDLIVTGNTVYNSKIGIDIGSGDRNIITDNIIYDCETGIALSSNEDSEVSHNLVHDIIDEGFYSYYWSANGEAHARNVWHDNVVYNIGWGFYESNVKGSSGSEGPTSHHRYYNNLLYNITRGFYFKGTTDLKFWNNTVYMNHGYSAVQLVDGAINADIRNNILSTSGSVSPISIDGTSGTGANIDYNCYHNRSGTSGGPGSHSVSGNPLFISPASSDFHLQPESPCINSGINFSALFVHDLDTLPRPIGSEWDMGCYEYASPYVLISMKIFLEGPYLSGIMSTDLSTQDYIPTTSPYSEDPREASAIPNDIVDWVLIQLRTDIEGPVILSKSVFLKNDGNLVSDDGLTSEIILNVPEGDYFIVVKHRNHLPVITPEAVHLNASEVSL
ncbi:right-handed parallel beta-helix repeat-containing protein [bacterium]|nr:right-handed parallel beta-helix repeat-containing protein [bacterium]